MKVINIKSDFSRYPAGRYMIDGPYNGENFRENFLIPALNEDYQVQIELDGVRGYNSSFLDEAFGGLIRSGKFSADDLLSRLVLKSQDQSLIEEIREYIQEAVTSNKT